MTWYLDWTWSLTSDFINLFLLFAQRCDTDGNGKLDYQEFKAMLFRYKEKKEEAAQVEEEKLRKLGKKKQIKKEPKKIGKGKGKGKGKSGKK